MNVLIATSGLQTVRTKETQGVKKLFLCKQCGSKHVSGVALRQHRKRNTPEPNYNM